MDRQLLYKLFRFLIVLSAFVVIYLTLAYTFTYIYPFILAVVLSLVLNPIVTFFEKKLFMPRGLVAFIVLSSVFLILTGIIILIISEVIHGTTYLAEKIPAHFNSLAVIFEGFINDQILPLYHKIASFFHTLNPEYQSHIHDYVDKTMSQITSLGTSILQTVLSQIPDALSLLPESVTIFLFTVLASFFIIKDRETIINAIKKMTPENMITHTNHVWGHIKKSISGFIKAQLLIMSLTSLTVFTGLIFLKIDYPLSIALFAALADILPFIGTGIIFIPWIIYLFLTANYTLTIALAVLYSIVIIQRQLLEPKILADNVGTNPLAALTVLFISIQLWGVIGLLAGPIIFIFGNALYHARIFHLISEFIKGS